MNMRLSPDGRPSRGSMDWDCERSELHIEVAKGPQLT